MKEFFEHDPMSAGSKGLVFIGDEILVYRRDNNTPTYPLCLDLPGGGPEGHETPFETFQREVKEEFGLSVTADNITYVRKYPSKKKLGKFGYFPVASLSREVAQDIRFGDEGVEYMLMPPQEYVGREDAWPVFQERTKDYLVHIAGVLGNVDKANG